ncbi:MAG: hypothetical protein H6737_20905 [Alphaproteobacteria bacterium]|nr:hypothetical protein [Alphaproteobacteria bacterium]
MSDAERQRRIRWRTAGAALLLFAFAGIAGGRWAEREAESRFGTGAVDRALDRESRELDATIMSSDATERGWLVSYEYFYDGVLEVGYQRVPSDQGRRLRFGTGVRIDAMEHELEAGGFPASSRLQGTVREPTAWVTRLLQGSRLPRWLLALAVGLVGLWWLVRPE